MNGNQDDRVTHSQSSLDARLAGYALAACGAGAASAAHGAIVANTTPQAFGINGDVSIDFNSDGQNDFQVDHDRVNLGGSTLDYLQIDKNDINGASNPTVFDSYPNVNYTPFPVNGTNANSDAEYMQFTNAFGDGPGYAVALKPGDVIGGKLASQGGSKGNESFVDGAVWDWQEGSNVFGSGMASRANRLIDEDHGQIDTTLGSVPPGNYVVPVGANSDFPALDDFTGLAGQTRYLGVRIDLNDSLEAGLNQKNLTTNPDVAAHFYYGWIGVQITNEADATGVVTGWAYENTAGASIVAGDTGPMVIANGDFDGDHDADGADFLIWQRQNGANVTALTGADANGDGHVDGLDLAVWKTDFGKTGLPVVGIASSVPEPQSVMLTSFGALLMAGCFVLRALRRRLAWR